MAPCARTPASESAHRVPCLGAAAAGPLSRLPAKPNSHSLSIHHCGTWLGCSQHISKGRRRRACARSPTGLGRPCRPPRPPERTSAKAGRHRQRLIGRRLASQPTAATGSMRLAAAAAAAARGGASHLLQPGAAQLSTSAPAASLWRQALAAAAAALGSTPAASGSAAATAGSPSAGALPSHPVQEHPHLHQDVQQQQQVPAPRESDQGQLDAWRRGAEGISERRQHEGAHASPAGQLVSLNDRSSGRRSNRRARRLEKQRAPEAFAAAAAAGQQQAATAAGTGGGSDDSGSSSSKGAGKRKGDSRSSASARPTDSGAAERTELQNSTEVVDLDAQEECSSGSSMCPLPPPRILQDDAHPIRETDISRAAWLVLSRLRAAGESAAGLAWVVVLSRAAVLQLPGSLSPTTACPVGPPSGQHAS